METLRALSIRFRTRTSGSIGVEDLSKGSNAPSEEYGASRSKSRESICARRCGTALSNGKPPQGTPIRRPLVAPVLTPLPPKVRGRHAPLRPTVIRGFRVTKIAGTQSLG